jgi:hypothetical protein
MVISTVEKETEVFDNIHADIEGDDASLYLGHMHMFMSRKTFERLLFTMQGALLEEELLAGQDK